MTTTPFQFRVLGLLVMLVGNTSMNPLIQAALAAFGTVWVVIGLLSPWTDRILWALRAAATAVEDE
jgi:hypothetical protein